MSPAIDSRNSITRVLPAWTLALSLAVHTLVLAVPFVQRSAKEAELPPLAVSFRLPANLAPVAAERAPEVARVTPPAPIATRPVPERASKPRAPSPAAAVLAVVRPDAGGATVSAPVADVSAVAAVERPPAVPARAVETSQGSETPDPAAMARYVRMLGDLLAQQQQYPRVAAMRGWEGEVRLRLQVARKGTIIAVHVVHSSGFDVLDQHAVQLVHGTTLPPPPLSGSSPDFMIDVPVHYSLKRST